jgi:hypothetical protein
MEFAFVDLRQIFEQTLIIADQRLVGFQLFKNALLSFILVVEHRRRITKAG